MPTKKWFFNFTLNYDYHEQLKNHQTIKSEVIFLMEVWKPIPNTDNRYYISNCGRVKSLCGKTERILKLRDHRIKRVCGDMFYKSVCISFGHCNMKHFLVHRLVAEAFVENPNGYPIINHKDEDPTNNNADNLEWCTYSYNSRYGEAQARRKGSRKVRRAV